MPPKGSKIGHYRPAENVIDKTPEYEGFMKRLVEYHEKRGTTFEAEPKIGVRYINLLDLYNTVIEEGGYDLVSDTKAKPLMWRKFAEEFVGKGPHIAAQAFQVKSVYYKNLAAFEISDHWKKEPPPKEILEDLTAKGGGIMDRTMDNYEKPSSRETGRLANGDNSDEEDDDNEEKTPRQDKMDADEAETTGRSTRGLRQAPAPRVLFQPDTNTSRQSRNPTTNHAASPSPGTMAANGLTHPSYLSNSTNTTLANYEPRQQYPLSLKPVVTPANNPEYYRQKRKLAKDASISQVAKRFKGLMLPGTGFIGPNIYVRAQLALQSEIPEEQQYALHHLVKISHERGDKYRFDQFPGLAEALINKALQVSNLFYDVDWSVTYNCDYQSAEGTMLDALYGTPDVLDRLEERLPLDTQDQMQNAQFSQALGQVVEAGLIIRNMVMLEENALYAAQLPLLRDYFCIALHVQNPILSELQHYALDTAEQVSLYYRIDSKDPFYQALLTQLEGNDRGKIVTSLRTLARLGMRFPENKRLEDVPALVMQRLGEWLMVEDDELRSASLDFLYQFTSIAENVEILVRTIDARALVCQLTKLLLSHAREEPRRERPRQKDDKETSGETPQAPRLAKELVEQLLKYEEPERSSHWLRMCFSEDSTAEMTQIDLWKSYQGTFLPFSSTHTPLIAGEFIKNVSTTFDGASAQVAGANKYVIRGIKPRAVPVDYRGKELIECRWRTADSNTNFGEQSVPAQAADAECGQFYPNNASILEHILTHHLLIPRKKPTPIDDHPVKSSSTGASLKLFDFAAADSNRTYQCAWNSCKHSPASEGLKVSSPWVHRALLARHIETHLPDTSSNLKSKSSQPSSDSKHTDAPRNWLNTLTDERNDAAGVPLGACLVMRNIARGISKMAPESAAQKEALRKTDGGGTHETASDSEDASLVFLAEPALATDDPSTTEGEQELPTKDESEEARTGSEVSGKAVLMRRIFEPVKERLFYTMAHNYVLKDYLGNLLRAIAVGGA